MNIIFPVQALVVSTATRVGMGNLVGVVAAICRRSRSSLLDVGNRTFRLLHRFCRSYACSALQKKDPLYGGYRGGPATISITFL